MLFTGWLKLRTRLYTHHNGSENHCVLSVWANSMVHVNRSFNSTFTRALRIINSLGQLNTISHIDTILFKTNFNIILPSTPIHSKRYLFFSFICWNFERSHTSSILPIWPVHTTLLDLLTLTILGIRYNL